MNYLNTITADPYQQQIIVLPDGKTFTMTLYYVPMQYSWFITNLTYGDFVLNSIRVCINGNMLYQWKNLLPFGLACFSDAKREPSQLEDFSSGACALYLLSEAEVEAYTDYIEGGDLPS